MIGIVSAVRAQNGDCGMVRSEQLIEIVGALACVLLGRQPEYCLFATVGVCVEIGHKPVAIGDEQRNIPGPEAAVEYVFDVFVEVAEGLFGSFSGD